MATLTKMTTIEELRNTLESSEQKPLLLFKHSTRCPISAKAYKEVQAYLQDRPNEQIDYVWIDVIADRPISTQAAETLSTVHESPQVILVKEGAPVWHTSHFHITAEALKTQLDGI
ncbi:general stress protein [Paenibacillus glucanolyticus]|uniref:General stress protein n=1 Tax=Paenibacillus glucanolyticus TaxID=59843 RepID=A0A163L522_9BACL|nr:MULTISPECIES: bacillithiol system redox-active protein YtxJ [Paenibacillus]AWP28671.1 general stress protein [Paenibacillus sp. Cedars]KZS47819.1 general stress protein [Paenibacillus glucanolyticus]MDH6672763.1 bacillithiol system protein YtxJ [Paenibacillus sp. LBL]